MLSEARANSNGALGINVNMLMARPSCEILPEAPARHAVLDERLREPRSDEHSMICRYSAPSSCL